MISDDGTPPKIYLLPNLMTAGNLFCGFMAVLQIFEGTLMREQDQEMWWENYEMSLYLILMAFIFDMLDGRLARLGGQESAFGREFDSLADLISFGIAPALLMFKIVLAELPNHIGWLIAFVYLLCGALRLARFNVMAADGDSLKSFRGFPIPAAAGLIVSITLLILHFYEQEREIGNWKYALAGLMIFLSFMMFSNVKYPSFKAVDWRSHRPLPTFFAIIISLACIVLYYQFALAALFTIYLLYGFFRPFVDRAWRIEPGDEASED